MNHLVSVIIPTYNRPEFLGRALDSVLSQSYEKLEVLVVNDGSEQSYVDIKAGYSDERIVWIDLEKNIGVCGARNAGIDAAKGEFVCFLDDDDEFLKDKLKLQMAHFIKFPEIDIVVGDVVFQRQDISKLILNRHEGDQYREFIRRYSLWGTAIPLIRKEVLDKGVRFDERFWMNEDYDFLIQLAKYADFGFVAHPLAIHHESKDQFSYNFMRRFKGTIQLFTKYWRQSLSFGVLFFLDQVFKTIVLCTIFLIAHYFGKSCYVAFSKFENWLRFGFLAKFRKS